MNMTEKLYLDEDSYKVWMELKAAGPESLEVNDIAARTGVDQSKVAACALQGAEDGFFEVEERQREEVIPADGVAEVLKSGLPERQAIQKLAQAGGRMENSAIAAWAKEAGIAANEVFKFGPARGWMERVRGDSGMEMVLTDRGREALGKSDDDEQALRLALEGKVYLDELEKQHLDPDRVRTLLGNRPGLGRIRTRNLRTVRLTASGHAQIEAGAIEATREQTVLSPEDIESGEWRHITLRPYDVTLPAQDIFPAKIHPMRKIMEETRRAFLEMGFTEVVSPMVESAFWNFDALFQPQDHPARDMQDTFYMERPGSVELPEEELVERVRQTHENGWTTGSEGWGYRWNPEESKRVVLRTHTTAASIRALAAHPEPPGKYFCVGWTYRNENISFKHLPVFHQVDGIVVDKEANLATLLGTLEAFYRKMGFSRVKFKPAFYPYTEPSVDVVVYMESRGKWIEMGGSGIFRPEVTEPLGCRHPVLAWGLGMERLAMLRYGFTDLRDLYRPNLDSLEGVPLCR